MPLSNVAIWAASPSTTRGQPTQLAADAAGERLAYAANKSIFLRSIDSPAIARQYSDHKAQTTVARFSPSGSYVASGDASGIVRVWDCARPDESFLTKGEYSIVNGRINDLAWDGDSQRIIAVGDGKQRYGHCFTWDSGNTVGEIYGHTQAINSVSIRQQRPLRAAAAGDDKTLVFYHGAPFKFQAGIRERHSNYIYGVAFSPDGSTLVSVGADRRICLYDGKTGDAHQGGPFGQQQQQQQHQGSIFAVSWSSDSRQFVTASADRTVKLWDVETGSAVQTWALGEAGSADTVRDQQVGVVWPAGRSDGLVISVSLSGDLNYLVQGMPKPRQVVYGHQKNTTSLACSSSSASSASCETLWTASADGRVRAWDVASGTAEPVAGTGHSGYIAGLATGVDGTVYSAGWDDTVRAIDVGTRKYTEQAVSLTGQPKGVATGHTASASASVTVLVGAADGVELFHHDAAGKTSKAGHFADFKSPVSTVAAHGSAVAVGCEDSSVQICEIVSSSSTEAAAAVTLSPRAEIRRVSQNSVSALAFSPDGSLLAVGDSRGRVLVFRAADGSLVTDRWTAHTARITAIAWNEQGTRLASSSLDTSIFVWSLDRPGDWIQAPHAHREGVNGVAWLDGRLVSIGADAAVKVWKTE